MHRRTFLAQAGVLGLALTACGPSLSRSGNDTADDSAFVVTLPRSVAAQLNQMPVRVHDAYIFALRQPRNLQYIPCYCGCVSSGHSSNLDCFVQSGAGSANPTLDPHGLNCVTCVNIALNVKSELAKGQPLSSVRTLIDRTFKNAGPGTATPLPPAA